MDKTPSNYLAEIGRKGGAAGKGASKRRPPEHYRRMAELSVARRAEKQQPERRWPR